MKHLTRCLRCNRILKDAKSIARGYGSVCYKKANKIYKQNRFSDNENYKEVSVKWKKRF